MGGKERGCCENSACLLHASVHLLMLLLLLLPCSISVVDWSLLLMIVPTTLGVTQ